MNTPETEGTAWPHWISPRKTILLAINAVCFGGCLVLLAIGTTSGPLVLLTIGTGLLFLAGLTGAIVASRKSLARHQVK